MTGDLIAFLNARLDEDEAEAASWAGPPSDRARQRREVEAKRAILALHEAVAEEIPHGDDDFERALVCQECAPPTRWPCPTVRHLAAVYSDHPDFRQEWAP